MDGADSQRQKVAVVAKPSQTSAAGVLPVSTAGAKPKVLTQPKQRNTGLKLVVRRLPPGLTETEFRAYLGDEWSPGGSRVDWASYVPGKVSKDTAKHSRPARAYLHLSENYFHGPQSQECLAALNNRLSEVQFLDAKGTHNDPVLLNPWPSLLEAPYSRVPSTKVRKDNRQGTIDQDQEFIDFLQDLTIPVVKPTPIDQLHEKEAKPEEKAITPLVQYLKDKKANKSKDSSGGNKTQKHGRQESRESKSTSQVSEKKPQSKSAKGSNSERKSSPARKAEKQTKESVKVLNKQTAPTATTKAQASTQSTATSQTPAPIPVAPKQERKRERGSAAAAAKILQRDLGLGGAPPPRRRTEGSNAPNNAAIKGNAPQPPKTANATTSSSATTTASVQAAPANTNGSEVVATKVPGTPREPGAGKQPSKAAPAPTKPAAAPKAPAASRQPSVTPTATQAFLKHANPSQGVTEELLQSTFASFGTVTKVEIDKKKGFAYVNFSEPAGLQKAISASPVRIAQGQVVVLERKSLTQSKQQPRSDGRSTKGSGAASTTPRGGRARGRSGKGQGEERSQTRGSEAAKTVSSAAAVPAEAA